MKNVEEYLFMGWAKYVFARDLKIGHNIIQRRLINPQSSKRSEHKHDNVIGVVLYIKKTVQPPYALAAYPWGYLTVMSEFGVIEFTLDSWNSRIPVLSYSYDLVA